MTQQQVNWRLGQENLKVAQQNADANTRQAAASESQAKTAAKRQQHDEDTYWWNFGANVLSSIAGGLVAWLI